MSLPASLLDAINDKDGQLAVELAVELSPVEDILARHGITKDELRQKLKTQAFRQMVVDAKRVWSSDLSSVERIRLKSRVLVEDSLLELYKMFHSQQVAAPARIDAFKSLARVAAVDNTGKDGAAEVDKVRININIGDSQSPVTIEASQTAA